MTSRSLGGGFLMDGSLSASYIDTMTDERFTAHAHVKPEEAGTVKDPKTGQALKAGDEGFMEAMAAELGFEFEDLT